MINNEDRVTEPALGTGANTEFDFGFKVFAADEVVVVVTDTDGNETTLDAADYTVALNTNQDVAPGGVVTLDTALTLDYILVITSAIPTTQKVKITNLGGFFPSVLNNALDKVVALIQQTRGPLSRALKIPISDGTDLITELPTKTLRALKVIGFDAAGNLVVSETDLIAMDTALATAVSTTTTNAAATAADVVLTHADVVLTHADVVLTHADVVAADAAAATAIAASGTVKVTAADTTSSVLDSAVAVSGLVGKTVTNPGANETLTLSVPVASQAEAEAGTLNTVALTPLRGAQALAALVPKTQFYLAASINANALTITLKAGNTVDFRSSSLTSGVVNRRAVAADVSVVVSSGSTLGTVNGVAARLAVLAIDNAGTVEVAVCNMSGGVNLDETGLISTTAISGSSNSATTIYSTTARTNLPYRVAGFIDITETTAGTWATAPTTVQGAGGEAFTAMSSSGYGQKWQTVTRTSGTPYVNDTGRPITVIAGYGAAITQTFTAVVNGVTVASCVTVANNSGSTTIPIPPGSTYTMTVTSGALTCVELR